MSLISGITNDQSFPLVRFSDKELYDMKAYMKVSQGTQDSKTVYFSILESSTIHQTRASAKAMYISISLGFGFCIYFLTPPRASRGKLFTISKHFFSALMNFITGIVFSVAVFGVFGSWKKHIEFEEGQYYYNGHGAPYFVWANKEAARSVLADGTTFLKELKGWALRSFVVVIPSLLVIPDLILYIGYYVDEFGLWYDTTIVEAFCFGLIIPLIIPTAILVPDEYAKALGFLLLFAMCISAIVCIAI